MESIFVRGSPRLVGNSSKTFCRPHCCWPASFVGYTTSTATTCQWADQINLTCENRYWSAVAAAVPSTFVVCNLRGNCHAGSTRTSSHLPPWLLMRCGLQYCTNTAAIFSNRPQRDESRQYLSHGNFDFFAKLQCIAWTSVKKYIAAEHIMKLQIVHGRKRTETTMRW